MSFLISFEKKPIKAANFCIAYATYPRGESGSASVDH